MAAHQACPCFESSSYFGNVYGIPCSFLSAFLLVVKVLTESSLLHLLFSKNKCKISKLVVLHELLKQHGSTKKKKKKTTKYVTSKQVALRSRIACKYKKHN